MSSSKSGENTAPSLFSAPDLEDFFENGAVGLHIVDGDGTILKANRAELQLLGYCAEEYIGRNIAEFHADAAAISDILNRLGQGERLDQYPAQLLAKDGSIRHVLITSSGLFRDGKLVQTRCFTFDVTEARGAVQRLRENEQQFHAMIEALPAAVYTTDADGYITFYNQAAAELAGRKPEIGIDQWCVTWRLFQPDGSPLRLEQCPMAIALKERRPVRGEELIAERPDGGRARLMPFPTPLFDKDGCLTGGINMLVDITERHASEAENARLAAIVRSSEDAIISTTVDGIITYWSRGATKLYGYDEEEMVGKSIMCIIPPDAYDEELLVQASVLRGEHIENYETDRLTKNGKRVSISLNISRVRNKTSNTIGIARVGRDVTARKAAERVQNLLMGELNHRVKNTLATVQAIANQSIRSAKDPEVFVRSFGGRLQALARAHTLLTDNSWQGTDLLVLVRDQLLLGDADHKQIRYSGPSVLLDAQTALHLALVLHELGTNARKYGSLSSVKGQLGISWTVKNEEGRKLFFHWKERGGPPVSVPSRQGFGTTLIERSLQGHGGKVLIEFGGDGVTCELVLPLSESVNQTAGAYRLNIVPSQSSTADGVSLRNRRILVIEDEVLVAMDVAEILAEQGCEVMELAATIESARAAIALNNFDAALLDANLGGSPVDELAAALTRLNIPFAFLTGYGRESLPEAFRHAPLVSKPYSESELLSTLVACLSKESSVISLRPKLTN